MEREELTLILQEADLFAGLDDAALEKVLSIAQPIQHKDGDLLVRQGEATDSIGVIAHGVFSVFLYDEVLEVEREITSLHRGSIFGEMGFVTGDVRTASIRAEGAGASIQFSRDALMEVIDSRPEIAMSVARTLAIRLQTELKARSMPMERLSKYDITRPVVSLLPPEVIRRHRVLPVASDDTNVTMAVVDPGDLVARNAAGTFLSRYHLDWVCITRADFESFEQNKLPALLEQEVEAEEESPLFYLRPGGEAAPTATSPAAELLDKLLRKAIDSGASDLHFEPDPDGVNVRARIDGRMTEVHPMIGFELYTPLVARVKVVSELNLAERRLPQDASLRLGYRRRTLDMRVSTLPTPAGESVVCRLLDPSVRKLDLRELIVDERLEHTIEELFGCPTGLLLVTGPTGSGKTTTLYAGIRTRLEKTPTIKLLTAEDPVEYELEGVAQVQVNDAIGMTYERILRALLRQDPDVLLVGEMRDAESMHIAIEAALTGHLVLSSLHTNSALETIVRLRQRGAANYEIASALRGVVSQRLVPRLCAACAKPAEVDEEVRERLQVVGILRQDEEVELRTAPGCRHCRHLGRKGRAGLYEVLLMTDELREAIESDARHATLREAAPPSSFLPMRRYAAHLLKAGVVCAEDILPLFPAIKL